MTSLSDVANMVTMSQLERNIYIYSRGTKGHNPGRDVVAAGVEGGG